MIADELAYYRPETVDEAVSVYQKLSRSGMHPCYYAGGAEILSLLRRNQKHTKAVIDIKQLRECRMIEADNGKLRIGSAVGANRIVNDLPFPLLRDVVHRIADHTNRNRITIGGNLCGRLMYREAALPLLLTDAELWIAGPSGMKALSIHDFYRSSYKLKDAELLVCIVIHRHLLDHRYFYVKKTKQEKIDYPLVSVAAIEVDGYVRVAVSGLCAFPFRVQPLEEWLNRGDLPVDKRVEEALRAVPGQVLDDQRGSSEYRVYVFSNLLYDLLQFFSK